MAVVIGDLSQGQLADMTARVSARMGEESTSISAPEAVTLMEIAGSAVQFVLDVAPKTPESIAREAAIRLGGWLVDNRPHLAQHIVKDPSGTEITLSFANHAATASAWRHSGASALVARYVVRRGGVIGGTAVVTPPAEPDTRGQTIMRGGVSSTGVFQDSDFIHAGIANRMAVIPAVPAGDSFAFWLPGELMNEVLAFVNLTIPGDVSLSDFMPAEPYEFDGEAGMLRRTSTFFTGTIYALLGYRAALITLPQPSP